MVVVAICAAGCVRATLAGRQRGQTPSWILLASTQVRTTTGAPRIRGELLAQLRCPALAAHWQAGMAGSCLQQSPHIGRQVAWQRSLGASMRTTAAATHTGCAQRGRASRRRASSRMSSTSLATAPGCRTIPTLQGGLRSLPCAPPSQVPCGRRTPCPSMRICLSQRCHGSSATVLVAAVTLARSISSIKCTCPTLQGTSS